MRRLASVFSKKDKRDGEDKPNPLKRTPTVLSLKRVSTAPMIPQLLASHTSSTSSASIRTPDNDDDHSHLSAQSGFWKKLTRRTSSFKPKPEPKIIASDDPDDHLDPSDDYGQPEPVFVDNGLSATPSGGRDRFVRLTRSKLLPRASVAPLLQRTDSSAPGFPSSCQRHPSRSPPSTLSIRMFRTLLLRRLDGNVSERDQSLLASFPGTDLEPQQAVPPTDWLTDLNAGDAAIPKKAHVSPQSEGVRQWINRPCFEDRFVSYVAEGELLKVERVTAALAIAALEYSDHLDLLAAPELSPSPVGPPPPRDSAPQSIGRCLH